MNSKKVSRSILVGLILIALEKALVKTSAHASLSDTIPGLYLWVGLAGGILLMFAAKGLGKKFLYRGENDDE